VLRHLSRSPEAPSLRVAVPGQARRPVGLDGKGSAQKPAVRLGRRQQDDRDELAKQVNAAGTRPVRWPWPERDLAFLATALLTGLRLSELNLGAIDGRPGERRIKVFRKGRKERTVPIEEPL
jgi:integrase